jgi:hypothetical protein
MITATIFRIFVATPSDVETQAKLVFDLIQEWNQNNSKVGVLAEAIHWKTHQRPMGGHGHPQNLIDRYLIDEYKCDVLIGIFGTRLGTPTDTHASGSAQEIEYFCKTRGRANVMLFFGTWDIKRSTNLKEMARLDEFKKAVQGWAIVMDIGARGKLKDAIRDAVSKVLGELIASLPRHDHRQIMIQHGQRLEATWRHFEKDWNRYRDEGDSQQCGSIYESIIAVAESVLRERDPHDTDRRWGQLDDVVGRMRLVFDEVDEGHLEGKDAVSTMNVFLEQLKHCVSAFQS